MAKGQHLSRHQKGIVRRYYEHADARNVTRLMEIVSDLSVEADEKKRERLWKSAETALRNAGADPAKSAKVLAGRRTEELAALVHALAGPGAGR